MDEIINNINNLKTFIAGHEGVLENEDYIYIYKNTISDEIKIYLVDNGYVILNDKQYITTLNIPEKKDKLEKIIERGDISINHQNKGMTVLDRTISNYINDIILTGKDYKGEYISYIIYILSKGGVSELNKLYDIIKEIEREDIENIDKILIDIIDIIDLLLLYGMEKIEIDENNELYVELFKNMINKGDINVSEELTDKIIENKDIIRMDIYNYVTKDKESNIVKISQHEKYFLYNEDGKRWVFNEGDIKKILETKMNPYTRKIILDDTISEIRKNYKN
jgi:hypothetical protein